MKKKKGILLFLTLLAMLLAAGCSSETSDEEAKQAVENTFTFANETGENVVSLKIRPDESYEWSENLLITDIWQNGYELPIALTGVLPENEGWQVQMTYEDGTEALWSGVNILDGGKTTFKAGTQMEQEMPEDEATEQEQA